MLQEGIKEARVPNCCTDPTPTFVIRQSIDNLSFRAHVKTQKARDHPFNHYYARDHPINHYYARDHPNGWFLTGIHSKYHFTVKMHFSSDS